VQLLNEQIPYIRVFSKALKVRVYRTIVSPVCCVSVRENCTKIT